MSKHNNSSLVRRLVDPALQEKDLKRKDSLNFIQMQNKWFPLLSKTQQETNMGILRRAIAEVKPCLDLRYVRRGRKMLSIPRIIPSDKRLLFGVRELLSSLTKSKTNYTERVIRKNSSTVHKKVNVGEKSSFDVAASAKNTLPISPQRVTQKDLLSDIERNSSCSHKSKNLIFEGLDNCTKSPSLVKKRYPSTRTAYHKNQGKKDKALNSSLSLSLGREIEASSRSGSRTIENKKQIYRAASANRGSIRLSWWL